MLSCLIELHYLPSIRYFTEISKYKSVILEKYEYYEKQSYRSRCYINSSQGITPLIVPITTKHANLPERQGKTIITDVRIDYSQKWLNNHWRSIQSAYGKAPFFEFYADALHKLLFKKHVFLYDCNYELLTMCLNWLRLDITVKESLTYEKVAPEKTIDLRNAIQPKISNINQKEPFVKPYTQVFGNAFVNNASLIDLVFCTGPTATSYL
jgi:WbqC-like protein family